MPKFRLQSETVFNCFVRPPKKESTSQEIIVLLHGYFQHGEKMYRTLQELLPDHAHIVAPNGPYPLPYETEKGFKVAYAWYFYDKDRDEYLIDPAPAADFICKGLEQLEVAGQIPKHVPIRIVGFSQGGYLAPHVALKLPTTSQTILIGASLTQDELPSSFPFRIDCVHGVNDDVVQVEGSALEHQKMRSHPDNKGTFIRVQQAGHDLEELRTELLALLRL